MFTKTIAAVLAAASLAAAAPFPSGTNSTGTYVTPTTNTITTALPVNSAVVTHRVAVGLGGLRFEPNNIVAQVGDVVEFKFLAKNHAVAESSFGNPCKPILDNTGAQTSFFSGFHFAVDQPGVLAPNVYQITVKDTKPVWFYCPQTNGNHCQNGMVGVINQNFNSDQFTLAKHVAAAALTGTSVVPSVIQGGLEGPNPNPNAGFP